MRVSKNDLTYEQVAERLLYDPYEGILRWRNGRMKGQMAGSVDTGGYRVVKMLGRRYKEHRLAWLLHYKQWPQYDVDHLDRNKLNNRIANLRDATPKTNARNVGWRGASFHKTTGRWRAQIKVDGKKLHLGLFDCEQDALAAYRDAKMKHHSGDFFVEDGGD